MARNVYVTALEPGSGKSAVVLGLAEVLSRRAGRLGYFRPLIGSGSARDADVELVIERFRLAQSYRESYALSSDDLHDVAAEGAYGDLLKRVLDGYRAVADGSTSRQQPVAGGEAAPSAVADAAVTAATTGPPDVVIVEGSDFTEASLAVELVLNVDSANHLGAPVLLVVNGARRSAEQVLDLVGQGITTLRERGCTLIGVVANRVSPSVLDAVRAGLPEVAGEIVAAAVPELPMLAAPTVAEVAQALDARYLQPVDGDGEGGAHREVGRLIVGAMGLEHFLERIVEGDLVITPGDRVDIIAGSLAAHLSGTYPGVAGLVLTGGEVPPAVCRLVEGYGDAGIPVVAVDGDTYTVARAVTGVRGAITAQSASKIAAAIGLFEENVDTAALVERIDLARPTRMTPLMFEHALIERAKADRRHIVLPEGNDDRILRAADQLLLRGVVDLTVLGVERDIRARAATLGLTLPGVRIVDPLTSPYREEFAGTYHDLRKHKGVTAQMAFDQMGDVSYFGTMMIHKGLADGMVSGAAHTTAHTIRPAFEFIRTAPGRRVVSSVFLMCLADRVLVYGDCAVVPDPNPEQLADIAVSAADTALMFGIEPRVAMLSYSTGESGTGADVDKVRAGTELARALRPDLPIEGPIQYDAAVDPDVARTKLPGSAVAGRATVFVFPDLNTGNNTYKAVQRSAGALAIGPVLQGLNKPVNDLSRGALVPDIVNTVAITAIQAQNMEST
ncbi:phosphate acetyltransferase [Pseudonocardia charpentierae]|uniref:Phosphate acetyltransferase n=1 Tax=Pseudonocardia charpentierae TaxID=3075545 RepID=A0ABU2NAF3_9PSEU|nr:phosphate acetyltransferase [Pseudonocardia sp. DSM 45834]MDT0350458.1 phosphate acetyltransferase [Pseudonocardia sp. DSM 45834]